MHSEPTRRDKAEEIFYLTHLALSDAAQRGMMRDRLYLGRWAREIAYVCNAFSATFDLNQLAHRIRENFPRLGLKNYFVVTYSQEYGPKRAELFAGSDAGQEIARVNSQDFDAALLLPNYLMDTISTGRAFAVLPLCCIDRCLGHALFELNLEQSLSYGAVCEAVAVGLYGAHLAAKGG